MSKVRLATTAGFCFGVERAVKMAVSALDEGQGPVHTLGPIIHNPQEVERLETMGIHMVTSLDQVREGTVVIRSHGAPKGVIEEAQSRGLKVVDATCTLVMRLRDRVEELAQADYQVVIVGEEDHPEVTAVMSFAEDSCLVTKGVEGLKDVKLGQKTGLVAQTTQSLENMQSVGSYMISRCREVRVFNTICQATHSRGTEAKKLAGEVDVMLVVGGRNSANTTRLAATVTDAGTPTYHIESATEIKELPITSDHTVGVTAGASTPGWVIEEVVEALNDI
jgi:4-hydroxy-3-methylbut-2-enyl diphosphate reductase